MEPHENNLERTQKNTPERSLNSPEVSSTPDLNRKLEHVPIGALEHLGSEESQEKSNSANSTSQSASDIATTLPTMQPVTDDSTTISDNSLPQTPPVAADDDVIEKEWVNKAKKVINQTKGDPYAKEREVSKLQADYMKKRYGKQVKMPDETQ